MQLKRRERVASAAARTGVFIHNAINHAHWKHTPTSPDDAVRAHSTTRGDVARLRTVLDQMKTALLG